LLALVDSRVKKENKSTYQKRKDPKLGKNKESFELMRWS